VSSDTPDRPLQTAKDVSALLSDTINQVRKGQLDVRIANTTGYLGTVLLRALEQELLEKRVRKMEDLLGLAMNSLHDPYR
jgi:hypothetical protein